MAFWLLLAGLVIYRMLATNRDLTLDILFLAAVLLNLGFLLLSYRNISRVERHPAPRATSRGWAEPLTCVVSLGGPLGDSDPQGMA
jgi:hypothetical protein